MKKEIKKKPTLKARGIRFSDEQWEKITKDAKADASRRTKPSDIVRGIVNVHYKLK